MRRTTSSEGSASSRSARGCRASVGSSAKLVALDADRRRGISQYYGQPAPVDSNWGPSEVPKPPRDELRPASWPRSTRSRRGIPLRQPQDGGHVVQAGGASAEPEGGADGAVRERVARAGAVGDLQALAVPQEEHGVIADDITAAHRLKADVRGRA